MARVVQTSPGILSPIAQGTNEKAKKDNLKELFSIVNRLMATTAGKAVEKLFPPQTLRLQKLRQFMRNSPLFGSPDNYCFSTWQVNISPLTENLSKSLGTSGMIHVDRGDDACSFSISICLSDLEPETYPGFFHFGETRTYCTMHTLSFMVFGGLEPHAGSNAIPVGQPKEWEKRINCILYPRTEFMNRTKPLSLPCEYHNQVATYSFFFDGDSSFGTQEYKRLWATRELFRHFLQQNKKFGLFQSQESVQKVFNLLTNTNERYIDLESGEGIEITSTIIDANELLAKYRPTWKRQNKLQNKPSRNQELEDDQHDNPQSGQQQYKPLQFTPEQQQQLVDLPRRDPLPLNQSSQPKQHEKRKRGP